MKNLKLFPLFFAMLFISYVSQAQERQNAPQMTFEKKSDKITDATGWDQKLGKWTDNKNQIYNEKVTRTNPLENNFTWIQMGSVSQGGKKYHVFFYDYLTGDYDYPLTFQDWKDRHDVAVWIMNAEEYAQFKSAVNNKEGKDISITSKIDVKKVFGFSGQYDESKVLEAVADAIQRYSSGSDNGDNCIKLNSQNLKGEDIVRFLLPASCSGLDMTSGYYEVKAAVFKALLID